PADLGGCPASEDRDKAERRRAQAGAQEVRAVKQPSTPSQPPACRDQQQHQNADADHDAERKEREGNRWALVGWPFLQAPDRAVDVVRQDKAAQPRYLDGEMVGGVGVIRPGEQDQRYAAARLPMSLDRRQFRGLMLKRVEAVLVANEDL